MENLEINNRLWIAIKGKPFLGSGRVKLLEKIEEEGSINKAARAIGMSYKRAWQIVEAINSMADEPIVIRQAGGSGGGGTLLTPKGKNIIIEFRRIDSKCRKLLEVEMENCCF